MPRAGTCSQSTRREMASRRLYARVRENSVTDLLSHNRATREQGSGRHANNDPEP